MRTETRHTIVLIGGGGATALLSLVYVVYAQRILGPSRSADFVAALALIALLQVAAGPINSTVARFTARYSTAGEFGKIRALCRAVTRRVMLFVLIGLVVGLGVSVPLARFLHFGSVTPLLIALFVVAALLLLSIARGALRGLQAFGKYNVNTISESTLRLGAGVVILAFLPSAGAGLSAYLIAVIAILVLSYFQLTRVWRGHEPVPVDGRAVIGFAVPMLAMTVTSAGFQNIDMLTVKQHFPAIEAGVYGAAFTLARSMSVLVTPFSTLLLPLLTTLHERRQPVVGAALRQACYFLLLAVPPLALFGLWPAETIVLLQGEAFAEAGGVLFTVTLARLLGYLCHLMALASAAANRFGFLWVYVPALLLQTIALQVWHGSAVQVAQVTLIGNLGALLLTAAAVIPPLARPRKPDGHARIGGQ